LNGVISVRDLMMTSEGRRWWLNNGKTIEMSFDLKDARSTQVLDEYLKEREKRNDR